MGYNALVSFSEIFARIKKKWVFSHKLLFMNLFTFALGLFLLLEKSKNLEEANGGQNNIIDMMSTTTILEQKEKNNYLEKN